MAKKRQSGEGSYRKEGDFYTWTKWVGKRRFVVKRKDYTEFRAEVDRRQQEIRELEAAPPDRDQTLAQFFPAWLEAFVAPPKRSKATYRSYKGAFANHIQPDLGPKKLQKLTVSSLQSWLNRLSERGVGVRTIHVAAIALKRALTSAVRQGYLSRNPCLGWELPKHTPKAMRVLPPQDQAKLLAALYTRPHVHRTDALRKRQASRYRHALRFKLLTGLRIGELLGLQTHLCDLRQGVVHVEVQLEWEAEDGWSLEPPKTKSSIRTIVLEPEALKVLRQQLAMVAREKRYVEDYEDSGLAFPTVRGTPSHPRNVQRQLDSALKKAELPHFGLHDLRRTCLTNLANRGFPMHQLKAYAGHSNIATTAKYYVGVSLEAQKAALSALKPLHQTVQALGAISTTIDTKPAINTKKTAQRRRSQVQKSGGSCRARTYDPLIKSQLLYQLS